MSNSDYNKFIEYFQNGNLDMAKLLLSAKPDIDISAHNEWAFRISCIYGHLEVAKWLLAIKPDIDISAHDEYAFRSSCEKGHLEVAKWLLSIKPDIDISARHDGTFRVSCIYGHLEVAKWLLSLKPDIDISARHDGTFRMSCANGHLELAKWLLQETLKRNKVFQTNIPDELNIHTEYVCIKNYPERCLECTSKYYDLSLEIIGIEELAREITKYVIF